MAQSATLPSTSPDDREIEFPAWARLLLIVVAAGQTAEAVTAFSVLLAGDPDVPGPGLYGLAVKLRLALAPVAACAALAFATSGRPRPAIAALAAVVGLNWLSMLPSYARDGLSFDGVGAAFASGRCLLDLVVVALVAILLTMRVPRLGLAAVVVSLPALASVLSVLAFAASVLIYGF